MPQRYTKYLNKVVSYPLHYSPLTTHHSTLNTHPSPHLQDSLDIREVVAAAVVTLVVPRWCCEQDIESVFGPMIAQGAEAKVYYREGDTSVIKARTSIYATLGRALESIVLHNALFPETLMHVIGFTRDADGLFRAILTQPYVGCLRLATKQEIDSMVATKGFTDNHNGQGVNYINEHLHLEDMHPANVFIDTISNTPNCIDCIVKFRRL